MLRSQIKTLKVRSHFENKAKSSRGSGSQFVFIPGAGMRGQRPVQFAGLSLAARPQYSPLIGQLLVTDAGVTGP